jgi:hypothetical protein
MLPSTTDPLPTDTSNGLTVVRNQEDTCAVGQSCQRSLLCWRGEEVAELLRFEELVEPAIQQFRPMIAAPPLPLFATRNMRNESGKSFVNQGLRPAMIETLARRPGKPLHMSTHIIREVASPWSPLFGRWNLLEDGPE